MPVLYAASDRAGAGKTTFCAALASALVESGKRAAVVERTEAPSFVGASDVDLLFVEGDSGLSHDDTARIADELDAVILAVIAFRRDLSPDDLDVWRDRQGDRLAGFVINGLTRYLGAEFEGGFLSEARSRSLPVLGVVPEDRRLLGVTVAQLAEYLGASFVVDGDGADGLVEHFVVGSMGMDPSNVHFGLSKNEAVIVRADRPDVQMGALGSSPACLVLTKGAAPIEYVKNEAELEGIPIMAVAADTLATMAAVDGLIDRARFDHPLKTERYRELLERHVDLGTLFGRLGLDGPVGSRS